MPSVQSGTRWSGGLFCVLCLLGAALGVLMSTQMWGVAQAATAAESLPYGGRITHESVLPIARAQAYLQALGTAATELEKHRAAQFGAASAEQRQTLAAAIHRPAVSIQPVTAIMPPAGTVRAQVRLSTPARTLDSRLRDALGQRDMLHWRRLLLLDMRASAEEGRRLVLESAQRRRKAGSEGDLFFENRVVYLGKHLEALWILDEALMRLRHTWQDPAAVAEMLRGAATLDPFSPLLWAALGEVQLQLDQPQNALESLNNALREAPDMPRALYIRGLGHLRLQQSALAEADLSAALRGDPENAAWLRARGAVRMVREDVVGMCADFEKACALGDCDGLVAARKRGQCGARQRESEAAAGGEKRR